MADAPSEDVHGDASEAPHGDAAPSTTRSTDSAHAALPNHAGTDANGVDETAHDGAKAESDNTANSAIDHKRKRPADGDAALDDDADADEFARQFSRAQVRVQVKRARLEANIAVQDEIKTLRFSLLQAEQTAQGRVLAAEQAEKKAEALQSAMDDILKLHQRTLHGMRDDIRLETLVASLDKEKATKEALRESYRVQNAELLRAQQRVQSLETQIAKYQKTETVLAQSIAHFQEQYASKDHERAGMIDRVRGELESQHVETRVALEADVARLEHEREALQVQLQQLQAEHVGLQETAQAVVEMQEKRQAELDELRARNAQFDTDKAVLVSKVDQVQKADAQLRGTIKSLEEQVLKLQQEKELLRTENVELGKIATDLMEMVEQHHAEKQRASPTPDKEADERLARTRIRLRESLG